MSKYLKKILGTMTSFALGVLWLIGLILILIPISIIVSAILHFFNHIVLTAFIILVLILCFWVGDELKKCIKNKNKKEL